MFLSYFGVVAWFGCFGLLLCLRLRLFLVWWTYGCFSLTGCIDIPLWDCLPTWVFCLWWLISLFVSVV